MKRLMMVLVVAMMTVVSCAMGGVPPIYPVLLVWDAPTNDCDGAATNPFDTNVVAVVFQRVPGVTTNWSPIWRGPMAGVGSTAQVSVLRGRRTYEFAVSADLPGGTLGTPWDWCTDTYLTNSLVYITSNTPPRHPQLLRLK
jgi:hypothetical protein